MTLDLWISIALAIPLAIVANIVSPPVKRWLDKKFETSKIAKTQKRMEKKSIQLKRLQSELEVIRNFHENDSKITHFFLVALLKVAMYGAIGSIYGFLFPFLGALFLRHGIGSFIITTGTQVTVMISSMLVFMTCAETMKTYKKIRDFTAYESESRELIEKLEGELK